jgi:uncharacterized membrane protein
LILRHLSLRADDHLLLTFIVSSEVLLLILIDTLHILHHLLFLTRRQHFVVAFLTTHVAAIASTLRLLALGATFFAFLKESHVKLHHKNKNVSIESDG